MDGNGKDAIGREKMVKDMRILIREKKTGGLAAAALCLVLGMGSSAWAVQRDHIVVIDPGHQGSWIDMSEPEAMAPGSQEMKAKATTGTSGVYSGVPEYQLNLDVSLKLRDRLEELGYEVVMTREDNDAAISNAQRAEMAGECGGEVLVRIHANGSDDRSVNGALAMVMSPDNPWVGELYDESYVLADRILSSYVEETGFRDLGIQYYDNMTGINWSSIPVMILEMGFMSNESDDLSMQDPQMQEKMAEGIAEGIHRYFQEKNDSEEVEAVSEAAIIRGESVQEAGLILDLNEEADGVAPGNMGENGETLSSGRVNMVDEVKAQGLIEEPASEENGEEQIPEDPMIREIYEKILRSREQMGEIWSVSVENLRDHSVCGYRQDTPLQSASIIKVFIMGAVYDRICYPEETGEEAIPYTQPDLRGTLEQMIQVSSNEAANSLILALGEGDFDRGCEVIRRFCEKNGYTGTSVGRLFLDPAPKGDNYTTTADCRKILSDIYQGKLVSEEASEKMLSILKGQTVRYKIPAGLPAAYGSANKTGEMPEGYGLGCIENDIAIVFPPDGQDYVLCVMSNELGGRNSEAQQIIQSISSMTAEMMSEGR